jgi:hypothetical protein
MRQTIAAQLLAESEPDNDLIHLRAIARKNKDYYASNYPTSNLFFYWSGKLSAYESLLGKGE